MLKKFVGDRIFYRRLFAVMIPVLVQNIITNFVSLLDNVMVGLVGTEQMSGVAIVNQLIFVFVLCIFGGLAGAGIFTAQYYGRGDDEGVRNTFRIKWYIAIISSLIFALVFIFLGDKLIMAFLHEGEENLDLAATLGYAKEYLGVMMLQIPLFAAVQVYASTLRETGETKVPMRASIVSVLVNLGFNYILIFGKFGAPALGVKGAAIATVMARCVECFIIVWWTHRHKDKNKFIVGAYSTIIAPPELIKRIAVTGTPLLINEVLWSAGMAMLNQCYSLRGIEIVSAVNIATTVSNLFLCAALAMGTTVSIMIGQLLGAGEVERAVDEDRKLIAFSIVMCTVVGIIMVIVAPLIPQVYNTSDNVKAVACSLLIVSAIMMPVNAFTNACYFTLRSGGKTLITFIFDSAFVWAISIPVAMLVTHRTALPILQVFIIVQSLELIKCIIGIVLVKSRKWAKSLVN